MVNISKTYRFFLRWGLNGLKSLCFYLCWVCWWWLMDGGGSIERL